jgi:cyclase
MKTIRIIPRLDIKGPNLVKGIHLEGLRVLGKPEDFAKYYYEHGADELIYMDVVASLYDRNSLHEIISRTAKEIFIPLTVGGGLRTIEDILMVLRAGADKVCLNTAAIKNPSIIKEAANIFGSSTIVIAIEAIKHSDGKYLCYTDNGREYTGKDAYEWASQAVELGAGELLITSVDQEGTGKGFDLELIQHITENVSVPVIAHGGAGSPEDIIKAINSGGANGIAIGSILHYHHILSNGLKSIKNEYEKEGNIEFLKGGKSFNTIHPYSIKDIKDTMIFHHVDCRPISGI